MSKPPRPQQVCIGLSIEGATLRLATVGRNGTKLNVMDLASMPLPVKQFVSSVEDEAPKSDNPFDSAGGGGGESDGTESIDFGSIREFIATHYVPGASFSLAFEEPYLRTSLVPFDKKKDTPAKIRQRVVEEIQKALNVELNKKSVALQKTGDRNVIAVAQLEQSPLIELCTTPQGTSKRSPRIEFTTSTDIALINMVRAHYPAKPTEMMQVIHVDEDVTRFYVMKGNDLEYIGPSIQQGAHDAHLVSTLYNRIELVAENAGYLNPDRVVLSGKAEEIGLKEEILENNPSVIFHSLRRLRVGHSDDKDLLREMNSYIAPISVAWEALLPKFPHFYRLDVTPPKIREDQKRFKLAWHGVLLLILLFGLVVYLTMNVLERQAEIDTIENAMAFDRQQLAEQQQIVDQITELEARSQAIRTATTTLDTLLVGSELWTETLDTLARGTASIGNIWVSEMKVDKDGGMAVIGYSMQRPPIPAMSNFIGSTRLREVTVQEIGKVKVFRYDVQLFPDLLYPNSGSRAARWHDSVRSALGDIAPEPKPNAALPAQGKEAKGAKKK